MGDRTVDEIVKLCRAAKFTHRYAANTLTVFKGEPPVMICSEPMMTASLSVGGAHTVVRVPVVGPVARMTMALHLGLTADEADSVGLDAAGAERDLAEHMTKAAASAGMAGGETTTILPSDPQWIEGQRAATPWRAPGKGRRRG